MTVLKQMRQLALCALFAAAIQSRQVLSQTQDDTPTVTPASSEIPTETPSLTPIATQVRLSDPEGRRFPTPFSHEPKFDVRPAPVPTKPRPTPKGVSGRSPWMRGPRALRGVDSADDGEASASDRQV